jgi:ribosomal protein S27AE
MARIAIRSDTEPMVQIHCPKCSEIIIMADDDEKGTYSCPYCGEEFEWAGWGYQMVVVVISLILIALVVYLRLNM